MQHLETLIAALDQCEAAFQQQAPTLTGEAASLAGNHLSVLGHHRSMLEKLRREATQGAPKRNRLDRGEFRLLFTFDERAAETAFEGAARAAQAAQNVNTAQVAGAAAPPQVAHAPLAAGGGQTALVGRTVADVERDLILNTLEHCLGNRTHAANILGISIRTLRNKIKEYSEAGLAIPGNGA